MKIGLIVAMESEYIRLKQMLDGCGDGSINGNEIVLLRCGIGKVNAALGTARLIAEHHPDCVVSTGVAGGVDSSLRVMDVVAASETVYHDVWCGDGNEYGQIQGMPARYEAHPLLLKTATDVNLPDVRVVEGLTCTGDQFITDRSALDAIKRRFPEALAVDMESAAIAHTCYLYETPFLSLRILSDTPGNTSDHLAQYFNFWATLGDKAFQVVSAFLQSLPNKL